MADPSETRKQHGGNLNWIQFRCLLWKNWLLQEKKLTRTIFIFLFIVYLALLGVMMRGLTTIVLKSNETIYDILLVTTNLTQFQDDPTETFILAYAPKTNLVTRIVNRAALLMGVKISPDLGFASETALDEYVTTNEDIFGALVFVVSNESDRLPKKIKYKIRLRSDEMEWETKAMVSDQHKEIENGPKALDVTGYRLRRFLAIQKAVDLSLIVEVNQSFDPTATNVTTQLRQYPYPPYRQDPVIDFINDDLPLVIVLSLIIFAFTICQEIVLEKENKFKELMKLMGMRAWLYWSSWFFKYLMIMLTFVIITTSTLHVQISDNGPVLFNTSSAVTFVFLLLYSLAFITFCFFISTLVSKASYGSAIGAILYFLSYAPYFYLTNIYNRMTLAQKFGASVDFNLAMAFGCIKIYQYEAIGIGAGQHSSNIFNLDDSEDNYTMGDSLIMLLVDTIIYSMLTWYLDAVMPGDLGTPQPFYFPFLKEYWMGRQLDRIKLSSEDFMTLIPEDKRSYFEAPVQGAKAGIQIRGLTKDFDSKSNPAVNHLNIDIYEGNITALVGHNGAGKTTTMFMLTGFLTPSKGTAFINGLDVTHEMDQIRQNLGLCPQHSILYDELTVKEHLLFFAALKGSSGARASLQMIKMIELLDLGDKRNAPAKKLSGGQKRKLSVGIALIAGSKFLILDEPTSGMDPESRRHIWHILQRQRKGRTIILSTHNMDEADILGDRIAIMSNGEIQCYGTPMFLKNKYGLGYNLTVVKTSICDVDQLRDVIQSKIPTASMVSNEADEAKFALPSNEASKFEGLFKMLETDLKTLGIESFGLSVTSMEEVFLRVNYPSTLQGTPRMSTAADAGRQGSASHADVLYDKATGWKHQYLQLRVLLYKRLIYSIRSYALILGQILIPTLFTILACLILYNSPRDNHFQSPTLDLTQFKNPITPYDVPQKTLNAQKLATCYEHSVSRQSRPVFINNEADYSTMNDYLVGIGKYHKNQYDRYYQIGATIEDSGEALTITGYFNNQVNYTIAISLSYLGNTLMQCFGNKDYQIETINQPLPKNASQESRDSDTMTEYMAIGFAFCLSFGLALLFATFVVFLIDERKSGTKHSQLVSGVKLGNFWLATFLWDYVNYLILCILITVVIVIFHTDGYYQTSWIIFLGLMLYGWAMLPFTYAMSFLFEESSAGFLWLSFIGFVIGTLATIFASVLLMEMPQSSRQTVELILYIFLPTYCFNAVLEKIYINYNNHEKCTQVANGVKPASVCASAKQLGQSNTCCPDTCGNDCIEMVDNYLSWTLPGVGRPLVFMVLQGTVFFLILYIIESDIVGRLRKAMTSNRVSQAMLPYVDADEDSDVARERERIRSNSIQELVKTDAVVIQDLSKIYGDFGGYFLAVNQLCLGISQKECFGLLGVNGAGKTTVFKVLTGEIQPSLGNAYIAGISVEDDIAQVRQKIGYCAQFDSIIDQMTVLETLWMYACAHGIPDQVRQEVIDRLIEQMTLRPYTNIRAGKLSGGNKRKLCVAVALMGNPTVVFLDEPTKGVDPEARRHVWNTLAAARRAGTTIILTSHSMEACEAICTRMGILINGRFLCLGSLQHLRDKFSDGYTLTIKLKRSADTENPDEKEERIDQLKSFILRWFLESTLKDEHENLLNYQVRTHTFKWSEIFGTMEKAKVIHKIEDYTVGPMTLEQLFIEFARRQKVPQEISTQSKCLGCC